MMGEQHAMHNQKEQRANIKAAAEAMSDLNTFDIVASILEGGHLHSSSYAAAERIIAICKREQDKRLRDYDRAMEKSGGGPPP